MNASTLLTMLVGVGLPLLVAAVTKESLSVRSKTLILAFLSAVSGILTGIIGHVPVGLNAWEGVGLDILLTFVTAAAADIKAWEPTGVTPAVARKTARFGIG
jgi:hypothetical protein